MLTVC